MNQVVLVGNHTDGIELRYTQRGVGDFTLVVSHQERHNGRWQAVTGFFRCAAWRQTAETPWSPSARARASWSAGVSSNARSRLTVSAAT